jgi:glucose-6-phosphate 1-dehydrogenase
VTSSLPKPDPTIFVLYGATGDLARRMVLPAFFDLAKRGLLPDDWRLVGNGRGDVSHYEFQDHVHDVLEEFGPHPEDGPWDEFKSRLLFAGGGFSSDDPGSLLEVLAKAREEMGGNPQHVHYLAVPPSAFVELTKGIGQHGLAEGSRVVFEKPFGTSKAKFAELDDAVHSVLDETQVFRIDHFLGKEGTQDLHVLRFGNAMFAAIWHRDHIRAVQIDVPETLDIADRAEFYDATGAVLDMLVTHLFQVAAEIAMEPPASLEADDLQAARETVIGCFRPLDPSEVVLGQFDGYRETKGIADDSKTDTFVAARLWIDSDRWRDVPFLLRTGKRMAASEQMVTFVLRDPAGPLTDLPKDGNLVSLSISGSGALSASLVVKEPGPELAFVSAEVDLTLADVAGANPLPPYVRLIHDVLLGDRSLFTRPDGLAHVWEVVDPLVNAMPVPLPYKPGSWGPDHAAKLAAPDRWVLGQ